MLNSTIRYVAVLFLVPIIAIAQNDARAKYIEKYSQIAVDEMNRSGIPASITLAQGILESGNGQSKLAKESNNHFGIKCHRSWTGKKVYHDDDEKGECFRAYAKVRKSYEDHTDFLMLGRRYEFLFELEPTDYVGWAKGLKKAGYATAPDYAQKLIRIIEDEQLYEFDKDKRAPLLAGRSQKKGRPAKSDRNYEPTLNAEGKVVKSAKKKFLIHRQKRHENGTLYVVIRSGESIETLSDSLKTRISTLLDYNDATYETIFRSGDVVYFTPKKAKSKDKFTVAKSSTTMWDISQEYAIPLEKLYKYNKYIVGQQPRVGDEIRLKPLGILQRIRL